MLASALSEEYILNVHRLLEKSGEILVLIYYDLGGGSRDFELIRSKGAFQVLLQRLKPYDEVTVFKNFDLQIRGIIDQDLLNAIDSRLDKCEVGDWLYVIDDKELKDWNFCDTKNELQEEIAEHTGKSVVIFCEPDWLNPEEVIREYIPNEKGIVSRGKY